MRISFCTVIFVTLACISHAAIRDYINGITKYLGFEREDNEPVEIYDQKIPYEVSTVDEKFLSEAAKLTGIALSDLDHCQHRVVLKLKTDCDKLNDEQLAKLAVHLLNCQSHIEGRKIFDCSDEMSIKECTIDMDPDTWTSYHLMSNRVRAVCYSVRQAQFRGLAEHTVNRLMDAARYQLTTLGKISSDQEKLKSLTESTYDTFTKGQESLSKQQEDLQKAQFHGQLMVEDNIQKLIEEKRLILDTQNQIHQMTQVVQEKLESSMKQLEEQTDESRLNHKELIKDLILIHNKTKEIFKKIDQSSSLLIKQSEEFKNQYESTLRSLQEVNETVHNLVALVGGTRLILEEKLSWITSALGGTDHSIERIYIILWHVALLLIGMLTCAFLSVRMSTRLLVAIVPPINLALALYGELKHLDFLSLIGTIGVLVAVHISINYAVTYRASVKATVLSIKEKVSPSKRKSSPENYSSSPLTSTHRDTLVNNLATNSLYANPSLDEEDTDTFKDYDFTPPVSRNGYHPFLSKSRSRSNTPLHINTSLKGSCQAKTRAGTPCKLTAVVGRDYCFRHQNGDSVMG